MRAVFSFMFLFCISSAFSQAPTNVSVAPMKPPPPIYLRDVFSTHIDPKPYTGVEGSPFVTDQWLLATIKAEGRKELIDSIPIKINVYSNAVHFINENGEEVQMDLRIERIKIIDGSSALNNTVFLSNFSQERGFFLVIVDGGKLKLLKKLRMFIWETQPLGLEVQRRFEIQDDLFFSSGEMLYKPSKSCEAIRDAFDNDQKIFDYISANKLQCNKEADMKKLVTFSASLK